MKRLSHSARAEFILALGYATAVSVALYTYEAVRHHTALYNYLLWNIVLAWIPLLLALWLVRVLRHKLWSSWPALVLSVAWLAFLPNSFYMISDYIHLQDATKTDILYATVLFTSFIYTGILLGFTSLYIIHIELKKRFTSRQAAGIVGLTLLLCSTAIYIGRDLRWNSWDILTNPGGVLFDVSDRIIHPSAYPMMILVIVSFFGLLTSLYALLWRGSQLLRSSRP